MGKRNSFVAGGNDNGDYHKFCANALRYASHGKRYSCHRYAVTSLFAMARFDGPFNGQKPHG